MAQSETTKVEKLKARLVKCEEYVDKTYDDCKRLPLSVSDTAVDIIDSIMSDAERLKKKGYDVSDLMDEINRLDEKVNTLEH